MNTMETEQHCPCESGRSFIECCGVEGRTAQNTELLAKLDNDGNILMGDLTRQLITSTNQASTSPDMYFARYNFLEERAYMIKMSPQYYQDSVFLDPGRIKGTCVVESNFNWIESIADPIDIQQMPMIFHAAFCGSTLLSQALHASFNVLSLREPECLSNTLELFRSPLRPDDYKNYWLDAVLKLLSKRYQPDTVTIVKTNDYANPMMIEILNRYGVTPSLFMYTPLDEFIVSCLKDKSRRQWIKSRYQATLPHTKQLFPKELRSKSISIGNQEYSEMAAYYWSYNIALFLQAWRSQPERIRSLDFNVLLKDPIDTIAACGKWFDLEKLKSDNPPDKIKSLFATYSKNSNVAYNPQKRHDDIRDQLEEHAKKISTAKQFSRKLLGDDYPVDRLPSALLNVQ